MLSKELLEQIRVLAMQHPNIIGWVIDTLEKNNLAYYDKHLELEVLSQIPNKNAYQVISELFKYWKNEKVRLSSREVAIALSTAKYCDEIISSNLAMELVWTGPNVGVPMRRTDQALLEIINEATKELIIISFAVYKIPELVKALKLAINRGVNVKMIVETPETSEGKISFGIGSLDDELLKRLTIFVWPLDKRITNEEGKYGSLHVKCAVADEKKLLISSANLTQYALTLNMEMGLLVHNKALATQVIEHISNLITHKILRNIKQVTTQ
ncbi:MAG: hypothetical protein JNM06_20515 [Blastocatellia bacterium]|nr:hypothetical protein [Blastocatellia bacterium]